MRIPIEHVHEIKLALGHMVITMDSGYEIDIMENSIAILVQNDYTDDDDESKIKTYLVI